MLIKILQIIELGKKVHDAGLTVADTNKRTIELAQKGYSAGAIYKMLYFEAGLSIMATPIIEGVLTPASVEAGAFLGFEIGFLFGPEGSLPGSVIGAIASFIATWPIAYKLGSNFAENISETIFDYDGESTIEDIDLSDIPTFVRVCRSGNAWQFIGFIII